MKLIKLNKRVMIHLKGDFHLEGRIETSTKWENPFSVYMKKGIDYVVKCDNGDTHMVRHDMISEL